MTDRQKHPIPLMTLSFVLLPTFERDWQDLGLDSGDDLAALETAIAAQPLASNVIPGAGGLRKMRFSPPRWQRGKSGALRVCYAAFPAISFVALFVAYAKNVQVNLSAADKKEIANLLPKLEALLLKSYEGSRPKGTKK